MKLFSSLSNFRQAITKPGLSPVKPTTIFYPFYEAGWLQISTSPKQSYRQKIIDKKNLGNMPKQLDS